MASQRIEFDATDGWVKVAEVINEEFFLENATAIPIFVYFGEAPLASDEDGHRLRFRESVVRLAAGDVWVRTFYEEDTAAAIVSI